MPTISKQPLIDFVQAIFQRAGAPEDSAKCVSEHLVAGDSSGHASHGLMRLQQYIEEVESGRVDPRARPEVSKRTPVTALIDGHQGFGQVTANYALDVALEMVAQNGLAAVAMHRTFHFGRMGDYPERAAEQGWIGLAWGNGMRKPPCVAPFGGRQAALGTNPFAAAIPRPHPAPPIVVDFATSMWAEGKVRVAQRLGKSVPNDTILDSDGNPSNDPNDFYDGGCLLPLGGHKGYGLSFICDVLAGMLTGSGTPCMPTYEGSNSLMLILLDPNCFRAHDEFLSDLEVFCDVVGSVPPRDDSPAVKLPGEPENERRRQSAEGVFLDEPTWQYLVESGSTQSLALPEVVSDL
ncbi:MAG: Ldh family oxidoreductase [Pirellulaceae bacterium]|nr:Ldh family oxidoreductase [Pirellulaceae bacterium]